MKMTISIKIILDLDYKETDIVYALEDTYWWHQALFNKEWRIIKSKFTSKNINIVDAGCGSGGFLKYLKQKGYNSISGFDLSKKAVELAKSNNLNVEIKNLNNLSTYEKESIDVITSNDALYFLNDDEKINFLKNAYKILSKKGVIIINLPAFEILSGNHDKIAQIPKRFTKKSILKIIKNTSFKSKKLIYWPLMLSPIILITRFLQKMSKEKEESDVKLLPNYINSILYKICLLEQKVDAFSFFGSSLLIVLEKNE